MTLTRFSDGLVFACWAIFAVVWMIAAGFAKRTAKRAGTGWLRIAIVIAIAATVLLSRSGLGLPGGPLWRQTPAVRRAAEALTVAGLAITLWARATLGANWSGWVALKENHELVERGPYRFARHPIYSGLFLMLLGTVLLAGTAASLIVFAAGVVGLVFKARREERLLTEHFPDAYPQYRKRVNAFFPFLG